MSHPVTCFYPEINLKSNQYPYIVYASTHVHENHVYHTVNCFVSISDLNSEKKANYCRQPSKVIGLVELTDTSLSNHQLIENKYKLSFKYRFIVRSDGRVDGSILDFGEGDTCMQMNVILYPPDEMISLQMRTSLSPSESFHFPQFIGQSLFVKHEKYLLPRPYLDLRRVQCERQKQVEDRELGTLEKFVHRSLTMSHLMSRYKQINELLTCKRRLITVEVGDQLSSLIFDIALGTIVTYLLVTRFDTLNYLQMASYLAYNFISELEKLINHLMLMPVGLKLNGPLNTALGHFFLYHIYLLRTYLHLIRPLYTTVIQLLSYIGLLGFTFILTVSCDIFSLVTIHSWCFYGYAVHIYSFNVKSLICLWRLFRGKKWNQLKSRVDSYPYQTDQLLIGCLSFTILLFLLPTVLIYYWVFLVLRLVMLSVPLTLRLLVYILSTFPLYSLCLRSLNSKRIATSVTVIKKTGQFHIITHTSSLFTLLSYAYSSNERGRVTLFNNLLYNIFQGNVITYN